MKERSSEHDLDRRIDEICDEFERSCQEGQHPQLSVYVERVPASVTRLLFSELIGLELAYRIDAGDQPRFSDYDKDFPEFTDLVTAEFQRLGLAVPNKSANRTPIEVECANGHRFRVKARYAGKRGKCHFCDETVEVPDSNSDDDTHESLSATAKWTPSEKSAARAKRSQSIAVSRKKIDRFEIQRELGRGAFGTVFLAHDPQLDRMVALKVPRFGVLADDTDVQRFMREARAAGQLRHPNIVPIYDAASDGFTYYIASAYVEGQTLRERIELGDPYTIADSITLLVRLARALDYAHSQGIVHRDVKPANIIIDATGEPHIMDFGLAHRPEPDELETVDGAIIGTPAYMSPEQAIGRSNEVDGRSDLWSLGVILYELLSGERPFRGNARELLRSIQETAPRAIQKPISIEFETICQKCISKNPSDRYETCRHFADDLERVVRNEPIHARQVNWFKRSTLWIQRNRMASLAFTFLLVISILLTSFWQYLDYLTGAAQSRSAKHRIAMSAVKEQYDQLRRQIQVVTAELASSKEDKELLRTSNADQNERILHLSEAEHRYRKTISEIQRKFIEFSEKSKATGWKELGDADRYLLLIDRVDKLLRSNRQFAAESLLNQCPKELRDWEWYYLRSTLNVPKPIHSFRPAITLAFTEDETLLATSERSGTCTIRDLGTGGTKAVLPCQKNGFVSRAIAATNSLLAERTGRDVTVWDIESKKTLFNKRIPIVCDHLSFSTNGKYLCVSNSLRTLKGRTIIYDVESSTQVGDLDGALFSINRSNDEIITKQANQVIYWDSSTWERRVTRDISYIPPNLKRRFIVGDVLIGQRLDFLSSWDIKSKASRGVFVNEARYVQVDVAGDLGLIATRSADGNVRVVSMEDHSIICSFWLRGQNIRDLKISGHGRWLSAVTDHATLIWDLKSLPKQLPYSGHQIPSSDGDHLLSFNSGEVSVWNTDTWEKIFARKIPTWSYANASCALSRDGTKFTLGNSNGDIKVFDVPTGKQTTLLNAKTKTATRCWFDVKGNLFTFGNGVIKRWNMDEGVRILKEEDSATTIAEMDGSIISHRFCVASGWLAVLSINPNRLLLIEPTTFREVSSIAMGPLDGKETLQFSFDGKELLMRKDHQLRIFDVAGGIEIGTISIEGYVNQCGFSPSKNRILATIDYHLWLLDRNSGVRILDLGPASCFIVFPDGRVLISGSNARLLNVDWGNNLSKTLEGSAFQPGQSAAADNRAFPVTDSNDKTTGWIRLPLTSKQKISAEWKAFNAKTTIRKDRFVRVRHVDHTESWTRLVHKRLCRDAEIRAQAKRYGKTAVAVGLRHDLDKRAGYWLSFDGHFFTIGKSNGESFKRLKRVKANNEYSDVFELAFKSVGDRHVGYANGDEVIEATDREIAAGSPAIAAYLGAAEFRDVELQDLTESEKLSE